MNTGALIVAIFSLIISTILVIVQIIINQKNNQNNLESALIKDMYGEILIMSVPKGREYIHYDGCHITGVNKLIDAISEIRRRSLYFKAVDGKYYDEIKGKCQKLEEYLNNSTREYSDEQYNEFMKNVDKSVISICTTIGKKYSGKYEAKKNRIDNSSYM